jgi:hypothetical protein
MDALRFEWDPVKAAISQRKHGVAFDEAQTAFLDDRALIVDDPDHSTDRSRFVLLGVSASLRMLVVVHVHRADRDTIRIISARRATKSERATDVMRLPR